MYLRELPAHLVGKRVMQLSDLHTGKTDSEYLSRALGRATDLRPDLLLLTGDFTSKRSPRTAGIVVSRAMRSMGVAPMGTFACLGNHDYGAGWSDERCADAVAQSLTACGVRVLRNEVANANGLSIAGLEDLWSPRFDAKEARRLLSGMSANSIVLAHNPDTCDLPIWGGFQGQILSGHTHGGQCKPPFLPPPLLPVRNHRYTAGAFQIAPGRQLYINRALGYVRQMRINVRPEITVFTLRAG